MPNGLSQHGAAAFGCVDEAQENPEEGAFSSSIWPQKAENLALPDLHGQPTQGFDACAVGFGNGD